MSRTFIFALILITVLSNKACSQNFDALTSKIFFNIDLKNQDTTVISHFKSRPDLTLKNDTGWTAYPPTDNKGNPIPFYTFSFSKHPYFLSSFKSGAVMVLTTRESDRVIGMSLSLSFKSKMTFDSTYKSIKELYGKCSSKSIKRPNIAQPFEVTKFISRDDSDYVIITKGEIGEDAYIHIAYNYQGYEW